MGGKISKIILTTILLLTISGLSSTVFAQSDDVADVFVNCKQDGDTGIIIVEIVYSSEQELCGLEFDLNYSAYALILSSCERGEALSDLNFDCSLKEGRIRFLFWGNENSAESGRLATVGFIQKENFTGDGFSLSLSLPTKTSAVYFKDRGLYSASLVLCGSYVSVNENNGESEIIEDYNTEDETVYIEEDFTEENEFETCSDDISEYESLSEYELIGNEEARKNGSYNKLCMVLSLLSTTASFALITIQKISDVFCEKYF